MEAPLPPDLPCRACDGRGKFLPEHDGATGFDCGACYGTGRMSVEGVTIGTLHALAAKWVRLALKGDLAGGTAVKALARLNLTATDLQALPLDQRIVAIQEALNRLVPEAERAAVASDLFGDKAALAATALTNAKHALMLYKTRRSADFTARADALAGIQRALGLKEAPLRIECFDVSHLGGTGVVASMVVFEDGLPKKDHYRRFSIDETTDDTDSIYQVLSRRLKYLREPAAEVEETNSKFAYRPSLLIVDGGLPQVNAAARAIKDSGVVCTALGLASFHWLIHCVASSKLAVWARLRHASTRTLPG